MYDAYTGRYTPDNGFRYNGYGSYGQPTAPYNPPQRREIIKVSGRGGAEAFGMAPNSSVLLLDEQEPIVWLKTTDGAGYPTLTPYQIVPYQQKPQTSIDDLEARIKRLEALFNESHITGDEQKSED